MIDELPIVDDLQEAQHNLEYASYSNQVSSPASLDCLVVDDDPLICQCLEHMVRSAGHRVTTASDGAAAQTLTSNYRYDVVISDIRLPKVDGLTLFQHIHHESPGTNVILMTAYSTVPDAVLALKQGVYEYLGKPINSDDLTAHLQRIAERRALAQGMDHAHAKLSGQESGLNNLIIGRSPSMLRILDLIHTIAPSDASVLITGESGTGKELIARALQASGPRQSKPFVSVNCAAFPESLLEAELFGHEKGAFTGAIRKREGRFKAADGGTILLDEIADMPLSAQAKVLRVLQEGVFEPVGTNTSIRVNVRVISATNRNLTQRIAEGQFRQDLYYRLKVIEIAMPPLREHRSDLPLLFAYFARRFALPYTERRGQGEPPETGIIATPERETPPRISPRAWAVLAEYAFPGNVREFAHAIEHASVLAQGGEIDVDHLPIDMVGPLVQTNPPEANLRSLTVAAEEFEREYLLRVLKVTKGKRIRTAELLGISRRNLWLKLRKHGISDSDLKN